MNTSSYFHTHCTHGLCLDMHVSHTCITLALSSFHTQARSKTALPCTAQPYRVGESDLQRRSSSSGRFGSCKALEAAFLRSISAPTALLATPIRDSSPPAPAAAVHPNGCCAVLRSPRLFRSGSTPPCPHASRPGFANSCPALRAPCSPSDRDCPIPLLPPGAGRWPMLAPLP
jgi:hypothetical protein